MTVDFKEVAKNVLTIGLPVVFTKVKELLQDKVIPSLHKKVFEKFAGVTKDVVESLKSLYLRLKDEPDSIKKEAKLIALRNSVELIDNIVDNLAQLTEALKQEINK